MQGSWIFWVLLTGMALTTGVLVGSMVELPKRNAEAPAWHCDKDAAFIYETCRRGIVDKHWERYATKEGRQIVHQSCTFISTELACHLIEERGIHEPEKSLENHSGE
jgi:hypothetical protein